jgi:hypothetical protein
MPKISACAQGRPRIGATIGWITSAKATIISPPQRRAPALAGSARPPRATPNHSSSAASTTNAHANSSRAV